MEPLEAQSHMPLQKSVDSKAGKRDFKTTWFLVF